MMSFSATRQEDLLFRANMKFDTRQFRKVIVKQIQLRFRLVAGAVIVIILGIGYLSFLAPKVTELRRVGSLDLVQTDEQLALKEDVLTATKSVVGKFDSLQAEKFEKLSKILPSEDDIPSLFVQMESLAIASGLVLGSVSFADLGAETPTNPILAPSSVDETTTRAPTAGLRQLSITMSVSGSDGYANLKRFLTNLESHIRLLELQSFVYAPSASGLEEYQISAKTYYLK